MTLDVCKFRMLNYLTLGIISELFSNGTCSIVCIVVGVFEGGRRDRKKE